jgi:predicted DNA-binding WGR domain protein
VRRLIAALGDHDGYASAPGFEIDGERACVLFLDHEEGFADRELGLTLEELLVDRAGGQDERQDGPTPAGPRRLTCTEGGSSKFWEGAVEGASLTVRFGKIGTSGQTKTKTLASADAAARELGRLVEEKLGKGYVDG